MMARAGHRDALGVHGGEPLLAVVAAEAERAIGSLDIEHRTRDPPPDRERTRPGEWHRRCRLMQRIELPLATARARAGAVLGHVPGDLRAETREPLEQAGRRRV